jgi:type III secretory pathway component EscU
MDSIALIISLTAIKYEVKNIGCFSGVQNLVVYSMVEFCSSHNGIHSICVAEDLVPITLTCNKDKPRARRWRLA